MSAHLTLKIVLDSGARTRHAPTMNTTHSAFATAYTAMLDADLAGRDASQEIAEAARALPATSPAQRNQATIAGRYGLDTAAQRNQPGRPLTSRREMALALAVGGGK